ncbi:hypothetical protein [Micromonospora craniellae]|uniref:hypothetical protein n=1 Tax=Micromonospora craniellae TaxID=2294034 RepID=UPI00168A740A|nr:hypothetical protein [Micromonospora craniellae]QOC95424.1 hypothetical protein ID554_03955 [Micromonospora craniellae]
MTGTAPTASRTLCPPPGYRLAATIRPLTFSPYDPCARIVAGWNAARTPPRPPAG